MKKFNSFKEMSSLQLAEIEKSIFNFLDDSRPSWDDNKLFYSSTADDFEPSFVEEAWNEEGESLGKCINIDINVHVSYSKENWVDFSKIFKNVLANVKKANED